MNRGAEDSKQSEKKRKCAKRKEEKRTCNRKIVARGCDSEEFGENDVKELFDDSELHDAL
jgi:hypothetical protein